MLFISEPDQSTVRAVMKDLSPAVSVIPVHAFAVLIVTVVTHSAIIDTVHFLILNPFGLWL